MLFTDYPPHFLCLSGDDKSNHLYTDDSFSSIQTATQPLDDHGDNELSDNIDSQISVLPPLIEDSHDKLPRFSLKEASETELKASFDQQYDDEVEKYWKSDHHRFEWPDRNIQFRSQLSWHSLGLPMQDSFIAKGSLCYYHILFI